jgi:hypothetical protein
VKEPFARFASDAIAFMAPVHLGKSGLYPWALNRTMT